MAFRYPMRDLPVWEGQERGGNRSYFDATTGELLLQRKKTGDGLLLLLDWHTHLLSGETGETVLGVVACTGLFMLFSGAWLYWPGRQRVLKHLKPHANPPVLRWASIHRFVGVVALPLLIVMVGTGTTMAYRGAVRSGLASAFGEPPPARAPKIAPLHAAIDWPAVLAAAQAAAPDAQLTRLTLPSKDNGTLSLRIRRPGEWNLAGRSSLWIGSTATGRHRRRRRDKARARRPPRQCAVPDPFRGGGRPALAHRRQLHRYVADVPHGHRLPVLARPQAPPTPSPA